MAQKNTDDSVQGSMNVLNALRTNWANLQSACGKHGVNIPSLPTS
jgi:hypothetical protein